jgi:tRNA G46 methylase TrmB
VARLRTNKPATMVETAMDAAPNDGEHEEAEDENGDFVLQSLQMESFHDQDDDDCQARQRRPKKPPSRYNSKKPKWWIRQSRKPGKKIRQAIYAMQDEYCLLRPPYGEMLDWRSAFAVVDDEVTTATRPPGRRAAPPSTETEVWIEIGFGLGDNLLCLAYQYPHHHFLGSEVHQAGVGHVLRTIQTSRADHNTPWTGYSLFADNDNDNKNDANDGSIVGNASQLSAAAAADSGCNMMAASEGMTADDEPVGLATAAAACLYENIRLYRQDITKLLPYIPDQSVHAILLTFPDPFPHGAEWRLLQVDVLKELHRVLVHDHTAAGGATTRNAGGDGTGGGRLYLATDDAAHYEWCRLQVQEFNNNHDSSTTTTCYFDRVDPTPERRSWLPVVSKYERKGREEGRETLLACWSAASSSTTRAPDAESLS